MPLFYFNKTMETRILTIEVNAQLNVHFEHFIEVFQHCKKSNANLPFLG